MFNDIQMKSCVTHVIPSENAQKQQLDSLITQIKGKKGILKSALKCYLLLLSPKHRLAWIEIELQTGFG